jgi:small GTP-binding protein
VDDENLKIRLIDTAGQERFMSLAPSEVKRCQAIIFVFDITCAQSFEDLEKWIEMAKENCKEDTILYLCCNKMDLAY